MSAKQMVLEAKQRQEKQDEYQQKRKDLLASPLDNVDLKSLDPDLKQKLANRDYDSFFIETLKDKEETYK